MAKRSTKIAKKQQQQQLYIIGGGAVAAIVVAVVAIFIITSGADVDVCDANDESCYGPYLNSERGFTEETWGYVGDSEAPIMIAEFADFACPHCQDFHETFVQLVDAYAPTGMAQFVFVPMTGTGGDRSRTASQAMYCAGEQDAYWQFHDEVFELGANESANSFTEGNLLDIADEMGLDIGEMEQCMNNGRSRQGVVEGQLFASREGVTATPTLLFSVDGGATWAPFSSRSYSAISSQIEAVNG